MTATFPANTKCRPYLLPKNGFCAALLGKSLIFSTSNRRQLFQEYLITSLWTVSNFIIKRASLDCVKLLNDSICHVFFQQCEISNNTILKRKLCLEPCNHMKIVVCKNAVEDGLNFINKFGDQIDTLIDINAYRDLLTCKGLPKKSPGSKPFCYYPRAKLGR